VKNILCHSNTSPFSLHTMVSTVLANVSMSSLNQAGTYDKMSAKVLRPLCFKVVVRGLNLSEMKNHFHSWWLAT